MPVFPGVLMCKLIHLRTQVRTVSVRICVYSYATSSSETDSCVQTGTSVDCVYMTEICRGTESCSIDSEEKKKKYSKKSSSGYFYHSVIKTVVWKSFMVISGFYQLPMEIISISKLAFLTQKSYFSRFANAGFSKRVRIGLWLSQDWTWDPLLQCLYRTNISSNNKLQRNYKRLKITVCMC